MKSIHPVSGSSGLPCLALAGPIYNNKCDLINWKLKFDGQLLKEKLKFQRVDLINDFQAVAYGVRELRKFNKDDQKFQQFNFWTLQEHKEQEDGLIAIVGVATGLGKSFLIQASNEKKVYAYATEGGHINFAPRSQFEFLLFQYILNKIQDEKDCPLQENYQRVSVERVVSGRGIPTIYSFLQDCQNNLNKNAWLQKLPDRFKNEVKKIQEELQSLKKEVVESNLDKLEKSGKYPLSQTAKKKILQKYQALSLNDFLKDLERILEEGLEIDSNKKQEKSKQKQEIIDKFREPQAIERLIKTWQQEDLQCREPVDPAPVIASAAIRKSDPLCIYTIQTFLEITAAVVSNCALHFLPYGGLYLDGGIPPQILPLINKEKFLAAFSQKGRLIAIFNWMENRILNSCKVQ